MKKSSKDIRDKIIGLGKDSLHKSYYPQLQQHIKELEDQKKNVEKKNEELVKIMVKLNKSQRQLKKSEMKYKALFDNANDAIFILNADSKCIDCNIRAKELLSRPMKEILNRTPDFFSPRFQPSGEDSSVISKKIMQSILEGAPQVLEWGLLKKDGTPIYTFTSLNRIDISGKWHILANVRDITEIKKLEQEILIAKIKAEENERERFAKELHDGVGPILSTIKLYFQWLAETKDKKNRQTIIEKGNKNIQDAINTLKEVSNNLSPHILINYGLVEALKQFINNVSESSKLAFQFGCTFRDKLEKEIEVTLYRVIIELINNTIKHAGAKKVNIQIGKNDQDQVEVTYEDDGIGFNKQQVLKSKSGLGMLTMQSRIKVLGGSMLFQTAKDTGLKVQIRIGKHIVK